MANERDRLKILKEIENAQKTIARIESNVNDTIEIRNKKSREYKLEIISLAKELKKVNQEQLDTYASAESGLGSISGAYSKLKNLQKAGLSLQQQSLSAGSKEAKAALNIQDINQRISQLGRDDVMQRAALLSQRDDEMAILGKQFHGNSKIIQNLKEQNSLAGDYSNLTEFQKKQLEGTNDAINKMKGAVSGVLDVFSTLTSGPMGFLGTALIGAGFAMDKLGHQAHELGTFFTESTMSATALSFVFKDATAVAKGLASELGSVEEATFGAQLKTNLLAHNLNLSGTETSKLVGAFARLGDGTANAGADMTQFVMDASKAAGVIPADVAGDLAANTEKFAEYGKDGGKNMVQAAIAAKKLGLEMSSLTSVTDGLLDIENSLTSELELGAMLGKNINFENARRLAYEGQIGASVKEAIRQLGGQAAFNKMDIFQKREAAKALGLSVGELEKMSKNMDKLNDDGTYQQSTFDMLGQTMKMIATGPMGSMMKGLGGMAVAAGQMGYDVKGMIGSTATVAKNFLKMIPGVGKISGGIGSLTDKLSSTKLGKGMTSFKEKLMSGVGDKSSKITEDAQGRLRDAKGRFAKAPKGGGNDLTGKGSLVDSFNKIDMTKVLKGAAALVIVAGAVFVFGKAVQEFMKVSWSAVGMAVVSMLALVGSIALLGAIMSSGVGAVAILAGAAAMVVVASSMYILGKALQEIGKGFGAIGQLGETLGMIVPMTAGIASLAGSIALLSGSLVGLGLAGIAALPGLMALSMVGGITTMVGGLFGDGESGSGDESMEALLTEIQGLRADLNAGKVAVYLDGAKVTSGIRNVVNGAKVNSYGL